MLRIRKASGDQTLQHEVEDALAGAPGLDASAVDVVASGGVVTLGGRVLTLSDKRTAGCIVARVDGVKALANDLMLRFVAAAPPAGTEIARTAIDTLGWNLLVPKNAITVVVDDGWLTLEGLVDWQYQKHLAGREVRGVTGVRGVTNNVLVRPAVRPARKGDMDDPRVFPAKMRVH